jgi:hypothetical protein
MKILSQFISGEQLNDVLNSMPAGEYTLSLIDNFGREQILAKFKISDDAPAKDGAEKGKVEWKLNKVLGAASTAMPGV